MPIEKWTKIDSNAILISASVNYSLESRNRFSPSVKGKELGPIVIDHILLPNCDSRVIQLFVEKLIEAQNKYFEGLN